jgi:hypothetical protein
MKEKIHALRCFSLEGFLFLGGETGKGKESI